MSDTEKNINKEIVELLTDDIQAHREHVQKLYRNAVWIGGVVIAAGVGLIVFSLGEQINAQILAYRIDEALQKRVETLTGEKVRDAEVEINKAAELIKTESIQKISAAGDVAKNDALVYIDQYLNQKIGQQIEALLKPRIEEITAESLPELVGKTILPPGIVAAFARSNRGGGACPKGWAPFREAGGRTIVGAGKHQNAGLSEYPSYYDDPTHSVGGEELVTITLDQMPGHNHSIQGLGNNNGTGTDIQAVNIGTAGSTMNRGVIGTMRDGYSWNTGGGQPHNNMPPYIALYFCKKD